MPSVTFVSPFSHVKTGNGDAEDPLELDSDESDVPEEEEMVEEQQTGVQHDPQKEQQQQEQQRQERPLPSPHSQPQQQPHAQQHPEEQWENHDDYQYDADDEHDEDHNRNDVGKDKESDVSVVLSRKYGRAREQHHDAKHMAEKKVIETAFITSGSSSSSGNSSSNVENSSVRKPRARESKNGTTKPAASMSNSTVDTLTKHRKRKAQFANGGMIDFNGEKFEKVIKCVQDPFRPGLLLYKIDWLDSCVLSTSWVHEETITPAQETRTRTQKVPHNIPRERKSIGTMTPDEAAKSKIRIRKALESLPCTVTDGAIDEAFDALDKLEMPYGVEMTMHYIMKKDKNVIPHTIPR